MNGNIEVAFIGRVGTEPEFKTSASGKPWIAFNVAVGKDDGTQWLRVAVFGDRAEELADTLHKGDRAYVEGALTLRTWEKNGTQRAGLNVAAWKCEKLGAIGRNKPPKRRAPPEDTEPGSISVAGNRYARGDAEIPF